MLTDIINSGNKLSANDLRPLLSGKGDLLDWVRDSGSIRTTHFGNKVRIHILDNVQNGVCAEDCGYCGQAKTSDADIAPYGLKNTDNILEDARKAKASGAFRFCMVMSGRGPSDGAVDHMCDTIATVKKETGLRTCLSAGLMNDEQLKRLAEAGLDRLNHNLNTSKNYYKSICTTHTWEDRRGTLQSARNAGVELCSGYIFGMGENLEDRIEMCLEAQTLAPESIPVNFLLPIAGNAVQTPIDLDPETCLRILCAIRYACPTSEVRIAAGREHHLRSLQALALWPANSLFADGYLLSSGDNPDNVINMIRDAGFEPEADVPLPNPTVAPVKLKPSVTH